MSTITIDKNSLSSDTEKVLNFFGENSARVHFKSIFKGLKNEISEDDLNEVLEKLIKDCLVDFAFDGYMLTEKGDALIQIL